MQYGYIDKSGQYVVNPTLTNADCFSDNGLAAVKVGDKWGYINLLGDYKISPRYDYAGAFNNSYAIVSSDTQSGRLFSFIDENGTMITTLQVSDMTPFSREGLSMVEQINRVGIIDKSGNYIINPQYQSIFPYWLLEVIMDEYFIAR